MFALALGGCGTERSSQPAAARRTPLEASYGYVRSLAEHDVVKNHPGTATQAVCHYGGRENGPLASGFRFNCIVAIARDGRVRRFAKWIKCDAPPPFTQYARAEGLCTAVTGDYPRRVN